VNEKSVHLFSLLLETLEWAKNLVTGSEAVSGSEKNWLQREREVAERETEWERESEK